MSDSNIGSIFRSFRPLMLMVLNHMGFTLMHFVAEASFNHGLSPYVYVTYRHIIGGLVMFPLAYFLERDARPKLTMVLVAEIFVLSFLGVGLALNMYFASLQYTSPTFVASMANTVAALTFVVAVALRLEVLDVRHPRGAGKVLGTLISLAGGLIMTLYKGPIIANIWSPLLHVSGSTTTDTNRLIGSVLAVASCISRSMWYIMQAFILKRYPVPLTVTTWMNFVGAAQSAIFTVCVLHKPAAWAISFNIVLWSIIYSGVVCSGLINYSLLWCNKTRGPVFVTMFSPLSTIFVALVAYFVLGEKIFLGRITGAFVAIFGMYLLLWGKEREGQRNTVQTHLNHEESELHKLETTPDGNIMKTGP